MKKQGKLIYIGIALYAILLQACYKSNLPSDKDAFDLSSQYTIKAYSPVLGRNTLFTDNFTDIGSSRPLSFRLLNIRTYDGAPAPELIKPFPTMVWLSPYTGLEKSLAEIEAKRTMEDHPVFEVREHSGEFIMWQSSNSNLLRPRPDSGYVFDVEISNKGGKKIIEGLRLMPYREREYEPNNADMVTGNIINEAQHPTSVSGIIGDSTQTIINPADIDITLNKRSSTGSSLTFRFLDVKNQLINPSHFNLTKWESLVHGFDMEKTDTYVKYNVAYPIPLVQRPTPYTSVDGSMANVNFSYDRLAFGGYRQVASFAFQFAIYSKGEWEIIIAFTRETPKFQND